MKSTATSGPPAGRKSVSPHRFAAGLGATMFLGCVLVAASARAAPVCARHLPSAPTLERLHEAMGQGRFVAYEPTSLVVRDGRPSHADRASIRADLEVLRPRFDSLITYGALHGAEAVPAIATELGFRALVIGIWNPFDEAEVEAALAAARRYPSLVVGISVGNELVFAHRRSAAELSARLAALRARAPAVPLATTEPFHIFYSDEESVVLGEVDFLLANVHPVFQPWFRTAPDGSAAEFVVSVVGKLAQRYCGAILVKETGVPTAPAAAGFSAARQAGFYRELRRQFPPTPQRAFAYFVAFDAPWRVQDQQASPGIHPEEAHWGLYDEARRPKDVVREIPPLVATGSR